MTAPTAYVRCTRCECLYPPPRVQELGGIPYCVDALEPDVAKSECSRRLAERKANTPGSITEAIHRAIANGEVPT